MVTWRLGVFVLLLVVPYQQPDAVSWSNITVEVRTQPRKDDGSWQGHVHLCTWHGDVDKMSTSPTLVSD